MKFIFSNLKTDCWETKWKVNGLFKRKTSNYVNSTNHLKQYTGIDAQSATASTVAVDLPLAFEFLRDFKDITVARNYVVGDVQYFRSVDLLEFRIFAVGQPNWRILQISLALKQVTLKHERKLC